MMFVIGEVHHALQARIYEKPGSNICAVFLLNIITRTPTTTTFRGSKYYLPQHSISNLPDCKTVVFNTDSSVQLLDLSLFKYVVKI